MTGWNETRAALAADRAALRAYLAQVPGGCLRSVWWRRAYQAVWLYRLSRQLYCRGLRAPAYLLWTLNVWITGADLNPGNELGPGLVLPHPQGVILSGNTGSRCRFMARTGLGGLLRATAADVGAGPGRPVLGDDVEVEVGAVVLGAIRVGDRVRIGPRCFVMRDVPDDTDVLASAFRTVARRQDRADG